MNPSALIPTMLQRIFRAVIPGGFAAAVVVSASPSALASGEFINETLRDGVLPAGWSATDVEFADVAGGYANLTGETAVLTTPVFDASEADSLEISFSVAKFDAGDNGPVRVEFSVDGGEDWFVAGSSEIPTGSDYIDDSVSISVTSSNFVVRFTTVESPSNKRLRDVVIMSFVKRPVPVSTEPATGTSIFNPDLSETTLRVTFDEPVTLLGSDGILTDPVEIRRVSDDEMVIEIPVSGDFFPATVDGADLILSPFGTLEPGTEYYVFVPEAILENADGNRNEEFGAPSSDFPWTFTVISFAILDADVPYQQVFHDFDGENLPTGWNAASSGGVNAYMGNWGSGNAGGFRGGVSDPGVLGYQHTGSSGILTVALNLRNDTGEMLDELFVSYLGRAERVDQDRSPEWTVRLNGEVVEELAYSTDSGRDLAVGFMITDLSIADGEVFTLTWESDRGFNTTGSSKQIGLAAVYVSPEEPVWPPPPSGDFASWIAAFGVEPFDGPFDTPAGDGVPNVLKHVLGLNPGVAVTGSLVEPTESAPGSFSFAHTRVKQGELASDVVTGYQWSVNLTDWAPDGAAMDGVTVEFEEAIIDSMDPAFDLVEVTASVTEGETGQLFIRIVAEIDP